MYRVQTGSKSRKKGWLSNNWRQYDCVRLTCVYGREVITFCVSRRRRKMYCGHARLCMSVCLSAAVRPHYCTDPDVTWGRGRGCPLVVHYWADLQSVHRLRCYGNITRTLVYAGCARVADKWPAGDGGVLNITAVAWTAGFQWWHSGDITRTQNVSEYMLVLALCLVELLQH